MSDLTTEERQLVQAARDLAAALVKALVPYANATDKAAATAEYIAASIKLRRAIAEIEGMAMVEAHDV